jgi:Fe-S oxidoreductase
MTLAAAILLAAILGLAAQALRLALRWRRGAPAAVDVVAGLRRLPRAYLHTVHDVMAREPKVARMHMLVAGGTLAAVLAVLLGAATGWRVLAAMAAGFAGLGMAGALIAATRRRGHRPDRLSGGAFDRLPWAILGLNASLALSALASWPGGWSVWPGAVLLAGSALWLVWRAGSGPMRHALAGIVHLVAHPRPLRFADDEPIDSALRPLPPGSPGIGESSDFAWNRLAMYDACVQCGKCEAACPAFAAGQPLNPKKLIDDLARGLDGFETVYAGHPHPDPVEAFTPDALSHLLLPGPVAPDALWSCTTCRACVEACPMLIEHVDAIVDLRRFETQARGTPPDAVTRTLLNLRETDTAGSRPLSRRFEWAVDLGLRVLTGTDRCDVLLWAGESAYDLRAQATLRALVRLLQKAGVDLAILGDAERDCGDLARRLGDEATFGMLARANQATLAQHRIGLVVSADPHVVHCLAKEYAAFGAMPPVLHHSQFLDRLVSDGRLSLLPLAPARATYHDPCYLGRYMGETDAPRRLLAALGVEIDEMRDHGRASRCCGGGGGAPLADVPGRARIPELRIDQARATGAGVLAVACPYCTQMLEGVTGPRPEVRDIAELMWQAVEAAP